MESLPPREMVNELSGPSSTTVTPHQSPESQLQTDKDVSSRENSTSVEPVQQTLQDIHLTSDAKEEPAKSQSSESSETQQHQRLQQLQKEHVNEVPSPRKMYHPDSFLSQSTGQELPIQRVHSSSSSMIFQQSGLNLNMQRMPMQPSNITKIGSDPNSKVPAIERQSSYLSFKASDRGVKSNTPHSSLQKNRLPSSSQIPVTAHQLQFSPVPVAEPPSNLGIVGNPEDDMDFSSFLNASQPQLSSRTQQKLWLQRETIASLNDTNQQTSGSSISNISTRFKYEEVARSFMHVRRTSNPIVDSLKRMDSLSNKHFKLRKPIESNNIKPPITDDSFDIDLSQTNELLDSLWKKSINSNMTPHVESPKMKNIQPIPERITSLPMKNQISASELFHMGQRSFGSQQKLMPFARPQQEAKSADGISAMPSRLHEQGI